MKIHWCARDATVVRIALVDFEWPVAGTLADLRGDLIHVPGTNNDATQEAPMANSEWYTPSNILELGRLALGGFDLDPASCDIAQRRVKARQYFTKEQNGLTRRWYGRVWLNPPFDRYLIALFVAKLLAEFAAGHVTAAILLTDNCTDTAWFGQAACAASVICFTEGRVRFLMPDGRCAGSPPRGQAFFYFGPDPHKFKEHFASLGLVGQLARSNSLRRDGHSNKASRPAPRCP